MKKVVLVTGGAGYIGAHLCKHLVDEGYSPLVVDNFKTGRRDFVRWGDLLECDMLDLKSLKRHLMGRSFHSVFHLASLSDARDSTNRESSYEASTFGATQNLLRVLDWMDCQAPIIFASSSSVYGNGRGQPLVESDPCYPLSPYGRGKLRAESLLQERWAVRGIKSVSLRFFNVIGADFELNIGDRVQDNARLLSRIYMAVKTGIPLRLFGADFATPDGSAVRDYVDVRDVVRAQVSVMQNFDKLTGVEVFNLGSGRGFSVFEIFRAVKEVCGRSVPYEIEAPHPGDPTQLFAECSKAREHLGFDSRIKSFESLCTSIHHSWTWFDAALPKGSGSGLWFQSKNPWSKNQDSQNSQNQERQEEYDN